MAAISKNDNIRVGNHTYHIQTEFYSSSNRLVTNIFKDGKIVKRIEREPEPGEDVSEQVKKQHLEVLERIREGRKAVRGIRITDSQREKLISLLNPFFGVATASVVDEAVREAGTPERLVERLLSDIPVEEREEIAGRIRSLFGKQHSGLNIDIERLEDIVSKYFGIITPMVIDDALRESDPEGLIASITSNLESREEREELERELRKLFGVERENIDESRVLNILQRFFGIQTYRVFEEAYGRWKTEGRTYKDFIKIACSYLEDESEREELSKLLLSMKERR